MIKPVDIEPVPVAPDIQPGQQPARPKGVPTTSAPSVSNKGTRDTKSPVKANKSEREKRHPANIKKSARIGRLVTRVQQALRAGDVSRVETLLDELASLKGEESSYVIKLKAFWCMKKGDYDSAESLLNSLLQRNENDLEAGINMAILELKTHRLQQARKRLEKLRHVYQDNTQIQDLLDKTGK
jgi:Flp pilus assembly protein TadD